MKKVGFLAIVGAFGLFTSGCGSSGDDTGDDDITFTDGGGGGIDSSSGTTIDSGTPVDIDAFVPTAHCNPVSQMGCGADEKCTDIMGVTDCAPNGTVAVGGDCTTDEATNIDNCVAGSLCVFGKCALICTSNPADSCAEGSVCTKFTGVFDDFDANAGVCQTGCTPLDENACPDGQGCYVSTSGWACVPTASAEGEGNPGDPCECANCCIPGAICLRLTDAFQCWGTCDFATNPEMGDPLCKPAEVCCGPIDADLTDVGVCFEDSCPTG